MALCAPAWPIPPWPDRVGAQWDFLAFAGGVPAVLVIRRPYLAVLALSDTAHHARRQVAIGCGSLAHGSAHIRKVE